MKQIAPGTKIKLTAKFLRNTGQYTGPEGISRWIVQACACGLCKGGSFVATDQRMYDDSGQRHLNIGNVQVCK